MNDEHIRNCLDDLGLIILDVLAKEESKRPGGYVKLDDIREKSGIKDRLASPDDEDDFDHMFVDKLLWDLFYMDYVENCEKGKGARKRWYWKITEYRFSEYFLGLPLPYLEICVSMLEEAVLDVLEETGITGDYMRLRDIANACGFEDALNRVEWQPLFTNGFTNTILMHLLLEKRVYKHPIQRGKWKITDAAF